VDDLKVYDNEYNEVEEFVFSVNPYSQYENTQTKVTFSVEGIGNYTMDADGTFKVRMYELSKVEQTANIKANVSVIKSGASVVESVSKEIDVWLRPAQLGDLVYYDGTFGSPDRYDGSKTVVGVCLYILPMDSEGKVIPRFGKDEDKWKRIMISCENMLNTTSVWGPYGIRSTDSESIRKNAIYYTNPEGEMVELTVEGLTSAYDSPSPNKSVSSIKINDLNLRDEVSIDGILNYGFKCFDSNHDFGLGLSYNETNTFYNERVLSKELAELTGGYYKEGDVVNRAYVNTLKTIRMRNIIFENGYNEIDLPFPPVPNTTNELLDAMNYMDEWGKNNMDEPYYRWRQVCFPLVSACYCYEPMVSLNETLDDKFKAHRWSMIPMSLLTQFVWYFSVMNNDVLEQKDGGIFKKAVEKKVFKGWSNYSFVCDVEDDKYFCTSISTRLETVRRRKSDLSLTRAICAF
jgi:hypothetical protein